MTLTFESRKQIVSNNSRPSLTEAYNTGWLQLSVMCRRYQVAGHAGAAGALPRLRPQPAGSEIQPLPQSVLAAAQPVSASRHH